MNVMGLRAGGAQPLLRIPALPKPHCQEARCEGAIQVLSHNSKPSPSSNTCSVNHISMPCCHSGVNPHRSFWGAVMALNILC